MTRSLPTIVFVLLALASGLARAQGGVWTQIPVPGGPVFAVADGDSGRVLIAGNTGAFRFDGFRVQKLPIFASGPDSLKGNAILRAGNGDIWFGAVDGAYRLAADGKATRFDRTNGLGNNIDSQVSCLAEDASGTIWAGTSSGGLSRYNGTGWSTITSDQGLPSPLVSSVAIDPADQSAWVGMTGPTGGLAHVVNGVVARVYDSFTLSGSKNVRSVVIDPRGDVWFGLDGGVGRLHEGTISEFPASGSTVSSLARGAHGEFWFGTSNRGVGRLDNGSAAFLPSGPPSSTIQGLFVDAAGVLWASTNAGLGRYEGAAWLPASQATGLPPGWQGFAGVRMPAGDVPGDSIDANGVTWLSTRPILSVPPDATVLVRRVNGFDRAFGTGDGLFSGTPYALAAGDSGGVWVGSYSTSGVGSGVVQLGYEGLVRRRESAALPAPEVFSLCRAGAGSAWVGTKLGVALVDATGVHALPVGAAAMPDAPARGLALDAQGRLWIATGPTLTDSNVDRRPGQGAVRFDPADSSWFRVTKADGLPSDTVTCVSVFKNGDVWFGTRLGAARWTNGAVFTLTAPALPSSNVSGIAEGPNGQAWIATSVGVALFDGANLSTFGVADGMSGPNMNSVFADANLVIAPVLADGTNLFHPDRTPPHAEIVTAPAPVTGSHDVVFSLAGGDLDSDRGILLSSQLDGTLRTPFEPNVRSAKFENLADGLHTFRLWAKDNALNETPDPTTWTFEVDATPPRPVVAKPTFNQVVKGTVDVIGSVADARFEQYTIELRPEGAQLWDTLVVSTQPPASDTLYEWDTTAQLDGVWELRVGTRDSLGLIGYVQVTTTVDNLAPNASVTAPAKVDHVLGGKVFTTDGSVEVDIPPNAFTADQIVFIDPLAQPSLPGGMPPGALWGPSFLVHAADMTPDKPATLTFRLSGLANTPASIYRVNADSSVTLLGGVRTPDGASISTTLSPLGGVVVLLGQGVAGGATFDGVRGLDVQPRVLSPNGGGFDTRAAISFEAGKPGNGAVKVFDRAGRLVREVSENDAFAPGHNVVFWDGRDADGQVVPSGIYVVAVRFDGQTQVASVAVANR